MATSDLLTVQLRDVSRSFYLTLRVLPSAVRVPVGLAYVLARTSDTIADRDWVPLGDRLAALRDFRLRILGMSQAPLDLVADLRLGVAEAEGGAGERKAGRDTERVEAAERRLLERVEEQLSELARMPEKDRKWIQDVLATITGGQELDLRRFSAANPRQIIALATEGELQDYTYRVAGCVGEFWTRVCRGHLFPDAAVDESFLLATGVRFGKGLQLVNILRDLPRDLREGRCYLPRERLGEAGLQPADLLELAAMPRFQGLYGGYLGLAAQGLRDGWRYTNALPRGQVRVRLACAWPALIGLKTLRRLEGVNVLNPRQRVKVTRREVRQILLATVVCYPWRAAWDRLPAWACR